MSSVPEGRAANQPFAVATLRSIQLSYGRVERDQALTSAPPCPATPTVREPCVSSPIGPREPPPRHAPPQPPADAVHPSPRPPLGEWLWRARWAVAARAPSFSEPIALRI